MGTEKTFFRVRLSGKSPVDKKMVNGVALTKQWQIKVGEIGDFAKFTDVEAQMVVKQGNGFVPVGEAPVKAVAGSGGGSGQPSGSASTPAQEAEGANTTAEEINAEKETIAESEAIPDFNNMNVEQLKAFLIAKGVSQSELRNATKPELIERAEFIWSQSK